MARLKVKVHGQLVTEFTLDESKVFIAGRKEGCDFVLKGEKGISREHFKLTFDGGRWLLNVMSKFGDVYSKGEKIQELILTEGTTFSVDQYEFEYQLGSLDSQSPTTESGINTQGSQVQELQDDRTMVGPTQAIAYIKISRPNGEVKSMIRLDHLDTWTAGRESSAQIHIDDARVSRKQFEIRRKNGQYTITDLGSVNGTYLNSKLLTQLEPVAIKSGDAISVLDNFLFFELHDPTFKSRLELVKSMPNLHDSSEQVHPSGPADMPPPTPHWIGMQSPPTSGKTKQKFDYKKNRIKLIIGALAIVAIVFNLAPDGNNDGPKKSTSTQDPLSKLTAEQKALVKQSYQLAKNYYMQGRYESARGEIAKLKEFVPEYQDSENINKLIEQALFIQLENVNAEKLERQRAETEQKVSERVEICRKKINPEIEADEIDECLYEATNLDPTNPKILELKSEVDKIISDRSEKDAKKKQYLALVAQLNSIFNKAEKTQKTEGPLETIAAYQKVVKAKLPDPNGLKPKSQRMIAAIKSEMDKKSQTFIQEADHYVEQKKLKEAVMSLKKAQQVNPTNSGLQDRIDDYVNTLKKQMMVYYQEAILEESFGNVDGADNKSGAKEKWKKIIELDVPEGEYYKKATLKLKKYGAL